MATFQIKSASGITAIVKTQAVINFVVEGSLRGRTGRFSLKGTYDNTAVYVIDDLVNYGGSSYAKSATSGAGVLPTDTTKWQLIAAGYDITISDTAPANPTLNSLWVDTS